MEQHPIPQDVTGFQFKLIGTMTVKQFGYVATGAILAVVCWYAPAQGFWFILVKLILLPIFGSTGVILAFVPIEGRPIEIMATNFIHALTSPNQYIYIKRGREFSFTQKTYAKIIPISPNDQGIKAQPKITVENKKEQQLNTLLSNYHSDIKNNLDKKEMAFLKMIENIPIPITAPIIHTSIPDQPPTSAIQHTDTTRVSDTPNVIIGTIKDARGNILPNILVEVKDSDGNPVRAFKTNPLGQFASATPVANGSYIIELEDTKKQHAFDTIQINADGQIMMPIEIISHDAREELRKALFN